MTEKTHQSKREVGPGPRVNQTGGTATRETVTRDNFGRRTVAPVPSRGPEVAGTRVDGLVCRYKGNRGLRDIPDVWGSCDG